MQTEFDWVALFVSWFPMVVLIGVWLYFTRRMFGSGTMSHGQYLEQILVETKRHNEQMEKLVATLAQNFDKKS